MEPSIEEFVAANEAILEQRRRASSDSADNSRGYWRDEIRGFWEATTQGIALVGSVVLLSLLSLLFIGRLSTSGITGNLPVVEFLKAVLGGLAVVLVTYLVLRIIALIAAVFVYKLMESLQMQTDRLHVAIIVGALTGLVITFSFAVPALSRDRILAASLYVAGVTVICQLGAAIGAVRVLRLNPPDPEATNHWPRFSLKYLIIVSFATGAVFGVLKATGAPLEQLVKIFGIWFAVTLVAGAAMIGFVRATKYAAGRQ